MDPNLDASGQAATNRIVNGDKYAIAPSPATSVFERRITTDPDSSSAVSIGVSSFMLPRLTVGFA